MTNADEYIQKFKELEAAVKESFGLNDWDSVTNFLSKKEEYRPFREEIKYCQEVRNLLQHKQKIGGQYPVEPTRQMISFLEKTINSVKNRKNCRDIMIPMSRVFYRTGKDKILGTIGGMKEISFSHIPILSKEGVVEGVLTPYSVFRFLVEKKGESLNEETTFEALKDYTALDFHKSEEYRFVNGSLYVDELRNVFESSYSKGRRLSMIFITSNGKPEGKLIGIITPWDILGKEEA